MAKKRTKKEEKVLFGVLKENFSEWYSEILKRAGLVDIRYNVKGFVVYKPWAMYMIKKIYSLLEQELEKHGHKPCLLPLVIPPENFEKEREHVEGFEPEVFWITEAGKKKIERLALRPTSETAFYQMYSLWIRSYTDLPLKMYQSCSVYRYETKATRPLIRTREILWIEAHDAFISEDEALAQVKEDMETTKSVLWDKLGIPFIFFRRPSWDKFKGAVDTFASDTLLPDGKILQLPSTHYLGQNFAKAFDIKFKDENGKEKYVYQTCYGPGISRILAAFISIHGDDRGLVLTPELAPVQIVIVPILIKGKEEKVLKKCRDLKRKLEKNYQVELDLREIRPGEKFYYWEMLGVPLRLEVGPKDVEKKQIVLSPRIGEKLTVSEKELDKQIEKVFDMIIKEMKKRAEKWFKDIVSEAKTMKELEKNIKEKGGFVKVNLCSIDEDGEMCATELKEKLGVEVRGVRYDKKEKPTGNCIVCGKPAKYVVYVGKSY
ncbi:MAG: proline--tRNA ligase [Candidatus Aenigmarchaeota archaeon]|nr:proline--tRNA ligase [Candidatus Aenigmarchaeota archaeon]